MLTENACGRSNITTVNQQLTLGNAVNHQLTLNTRSTIS